MLVSLEPYSLVSFFSRLKGSVLYMISSEYRKSALNVQRLISRLVKCFLYQIYLFGVNKITRTNIGGLKNVFNMHFVGQLNPVTEIKSKVFRLDYLV